MPARLSFFKFYVLSQLPSVAVRIAVRKKARFFFTEIFCMSGICCTFASANGGSIERMGSGCMERRLCRKDAASSKEAGERGGRKDDNAEIAQLVEHNLAKVGVAGSSPVFRSRAEGRVPISEAQRKELPKWRNW